MAKGKTVSKVNPANKDISKKTVAIILGVLMVVTVFMMLALVDQKMTLREIVFSRSRGHVSLEIQKAPPVAASVVEAPLAGGAVVDLTG